MFGVVEVTGQAQISQKQVTLVDIFNVLVNDLLGGNPHVVVIGVICPD